MKNGIPKKILKISIIYAVFLNLAGCIGFRPPEEGKNYQVGTASWYGKDFHGKPTASGEIYDMYKCTAAHKTAPLGTYATVKNLDNGRKVSVKINDRGPFVGGRIIDLSYAAAKKIEMIGTGTAKVEVLFQGGFAPPEKSDQSYFVQVGAFLERENAENLKGQLEEKHKNVLIRSAQNSGKLFHRVCLGPLKADDEIMKAKEEMTNSGFSPIVTLGNCGGY